VLRSVWLPAWYDENKRGQGAFSSVLRVDLRERVREILAGASGVLRGHPGEAVRIASSSLGAQQTSGTNDVEHSLRMHAAQPEPTVSVQIE